MQPVGQLDDDDADIVHHREQHLAIALRLPVLGGEEIDLAQFGDAIDAACDFVAEVLLDIGGGDGGVFDDVVQQSRFDADDIHAHVGENARHGERVAHVGLARRPLLAGVVLRRELVSLLDGREVVLRTGFADDGDQLVDFSSGAGRVDNSTPGSVPETAGTLPFYERGNSLACSRTPKTKGGRINRARLI